MLYLDAALSVLHFSFAFILAGALSAELFVLRLPVSAQVARLLLRIDVFYGLSAAGVLLAGAARVAWGAGGWDYYAGQPFFWAKLAVFAAIGLLSVVPTLTYFRWVRGAAEASFQAPDAEINRVRTLVMVEIHLLVALILCAALMARGIGGET